MTDDRRQIHLNAFTMNCTGHQAPGLWSHPESQEDRYTDLDYWVELARTLERGRFDAIFLADVYGIYDVFGGSRETAIRRGTQTPRNDPMFLIPAMAHATEHLGFASTYSVTYTRPYMTAQRFSTLDHLTDGRVAWNIVTSYLESATRNLLGEDEMPPHDERYDLADEYAEVCYKLWEHSWDEDAVVKDAENRVYTDPDRVHTIDHEGEYFKVPGPHIAEPSPQRTPVIYQAGSSPRGREYASKHAEGVFTIGPTVDVVRGYTEDIRQRAEKHGRDPSDILVFPGITPIVAATEEQARQKYESYRRHVAYEGALTLMSGWTRIDFSELDPDQKLEYVESDAVQTAVDAFTRADPDREWTVREVTKYLGLGGLAPVIVGDPVQVADELERWMEEADVDGFNIFEVVRPGTLRDFVELVVPELQRRGLLRREYEGETLRENMYGKGRKRLPETHPARKAGRNGGRSAGADDAEPAEEAAPAPAAV